MPVTLYGRDAELARIDRLLTDAREGRSGVLIISGEAGIGKSTLLDHAARQADGIRILHGVGIEYEAKMAFAALHLLLHPFTDRFDALPPLQAGALRGALGLGETPATDRFLVGLAVLTLLSDLAEEGPLLCLVDDAQWIDQASHEALMFAARRLEAEPVAFIMAARDAPGAMPTSGPCELRPGRLDRATATALLAEHSGHLAARVRDRLIKEADGNPLALIELPRALTPEQLAGRLSPLTFTIETLPTSSRIQRAFSNQIQALSETARALLLVAAADDTGDPTVVLRAARRLGASLDDLESVERRQLLQVTTDRLVFRHPLIRAAAYEGVPHARRIAVHRALAEALKGDEHADRRAWHLASATTEPDEEVATLLERSAEQGRARGGYPAVAAAYERAAQLSPDPRRRADRLAIAAQAADNAGQARRAAVLADRAAPYVTDPVTRAELAKFRATALYREGRLRESHDMLLKAASGVADLAPERAAFMILEAMTAAWDAGSEALIADTSARLAELRLPATPTVQPITRGAVGLAHMFAGEPEKGVAALRDLIAGARSLGGSLGLWERAGIEAWDLLVGDFEATHERAADLERACRMQGAIGVLPRALLHLARAQLLVGMHRDALASAFEGLRIAGDTGQHHYTGYLTGVVAYLAAIKGDEEHCRAKAEESLAHGIVPAGGWSTCALALLDLGLGRYEMAFHRLEEIAAGPARHSVIALCSLPDLVESAIRIGRPDRASAALARFDEWATQTGQPWARGVALRCHALLASDEKAERHFAEAVRLHTLGRQPFERARSELAYGEWLRRTHRRSDARARLRTALHTFVRLDATPWSERAANELRATGESQVRHDDHPDLPAGLTPRELHVVRLAAAGLTNRDIGAQLFLSPRTVSYHLYKAFPKLGVSSRNDLTRLIPKEIPPDK